MHQKEARLRTKPTTPENSAQHMKLFASGPAATAAHELACRCGRGGGRAPCRRGSSNTAGSSPRNQARGRQIGSDRMLL